MRVLVVYASRYGATRGIAERLARTLTDAGRPADVADVSEVADLARYDAFVIGSAAYMGSWLEEATEFANTNLEELASRPVWLFSSGPLGTSPTDEEGRDLREQAVPRQFGELAQTLAPQDRQVFFGALEPSRLRLSHRLLRRLPAGRRLLPAGDFRDWDAIDEWARGIARALSVPSDRD
jgi:menaquinone-dependent protoporphyrinogen oxidase